MSLFSKSIVALAVLTGALAASSAFAGSCPEGHDLKTPQQLVAPPDLGASRQVLDFVDLSGWRGVEGLALRMRRLVVAKDGFVPLHWHNDRPSIVYVVSGEIIEHSALCGTPITHKSGEWTPEFGVGHAHWWENKSGAEVVLISTDVVTVENVHF